MALLDADEERALGGEIAAGDIQARNRMVLANARFVVSIAKKYWTRGIDFLDLIQAGNLGLIGAAGRFDVRKGCRLVTYAKREIQGRVQRARHAEMKHMTRRAVASDDPDDGDMLETIRDDRAGMPEEYVFGQIDRETVRRLVDDIGGRAATVLRQRFGFDGERGRTREQIAGRLGVTAERVRQIEQRALRRMKKLLEDE